MRAFLTLVHRWAGLVMTGFLLVVGLTGSLLAWLDELEDLISPQLRLVAPPSPQARPLDPFVLREAVLAHVPAARSDWVPLRVEPGRSVRFGLSGGPSLANDEVFVDPYTGKVLGERKWCDITQGTKYLMSFVYRLHYSLALDAAGATVLGVVALAWTIDCFIGVYLTLPPRRRAAAQAGRKSWWSRWWPAWRLRWRAGGYKFKFDLHRAGGLWTWAMLFVLAWSSVAFNLSEVYAPVTRQLLSQQQAQPNRSHIPVLARPRNDPAIAPQAARETGRRLMADQAVLRGLTVHREEGLGYDPKRGVYTYMVRTDRDIRVRYGGNTRLFFDGDNGALRGLYLPTGEAPGDSFTAWLTTLHMAAIWGWPLQLLVCIMGLVTALLSATGLVIWWRKKAARTTSRAAGRRVAGE